MGPSRRASLTRSWLRFGAACTCVHVACISRPSPVDATVAQAAATPTSGGTDAGDASRDDVVWARETASPRPEDVVDPRERALTDACGDADVALHEVARAIASQRARGGGVPDPDVTLQRLRAAGEPHVAPRLFVASGRGSLVDDALRARFDDARGSAGPRSNDAIPSRGRPRCGVAIASVGHGGELAVAVRVEALADLAPLPMRARAGEWLTFSAEVHVPVTAAKLVVLGPHGVPRTVPTTVDPRTNAVTARFALESPGAFTVQLVGTLEDGPRPLLEARVFADTVPPTSFDDEPAPGEDADAERELPPADALARMVGALRSAEGQRPLTRDATLDALARAHAERMRQTRSVSHDLGDGDVRARFEEAGGSGRAIGENVARAASVTRIHRALFASASHRMNLLRADYTHMGIGVVESDGTLYACEVFVAR